jgi:hypothetical protein
VGETKRKVYKNTPRTAEVLQNKVRNVVASISADEIQRVSQGFLRRCKACLWASGSHFDTFLGSGDNEGPPLWSGGQSFWLQIQRSRVRFPALPDFLRSRGSGTGST